MCFNGLYALDESIQEIIKDCSFYEYIYIGQPIAVQLSASRSWMKNSYMVYLNMSIMSTKLDFPAKE